MCHLHKYEEKTGTHSAIKIHRFFCYFIFVIYFCTTRNRESCCFSSAVEHFLGKEEVPGSSPGNSSKKRGCLTSHRHPLYLFVLLSGNHFRTCDSRKIKNLPAPLQPHAQCRCRSYSNDFADRRHKKAALPCSFSPRFRFSAERARLRVTTYRASFPPSGRRRPYELLIFACAPYAQLLFSDRSG